MNKNLVNLCIKSMKPARRYLQDIYFKTLKTDKWLYVPSIYSNRYSTFEVEDATKEAYNKYMSQKNKLKKFT